MTRSSIWTLLLALTASLLPLRAQDQPDLRTLLRDALFTEEVTRDAEKAAQQYEQLLARHAEHQAFAATALFRLAEVRRKQNRNDEAIALYQRLIREFPTATTEVKLATENLATLGAKPLDPTTPSPIDEDTRELRRLQKWVESSPDRLKDPELLLTAVKEGHLSSIDFLLKAGAAAEPWKLLREAATTGNLRTTTLILDFPFENGHLGLEEALFTAVSLDYHDVTKLLLSRGANPNDREGHYRIAENTLPPTKSTAQMTALHVAVRKNNIELCKLLLDHKADPNRLTTFPDSLISINKGNPGPPAGTPLHDAVLTSLEITRLLIDHGANVNAAPESTGVTPLHLAVRVDDNEKIIQLLVEKGAELEAKTLQIQPVQPDRDLSQPLAPYAPGSTPLQIALAFQQIPNARLLISLGASVKHPGVIIAAVHTLKPEIVELLIEANALKANSPEDPIQHISTRKVYPQQVQATLKILDLLITHGAKPAPKWIDSSFAGATPHCAPILYQRFIAPRLLEKPAVTVIIPTLESCSTIELASGTSEQSLPSLASLMLKKQTRWPIMTFSFNSHFPTLLTRWRKNTEGTPEPLHANLDSPEPLPSIQWGDVLELSYNWEKLGERPASYSIDFTDQLPAEISWALRRHITFPITTEIAGTTRDITLRGDKLIFDPGSDQVPLVGASKLMSLLWQPNFTDGSVPTITLIRQGWPDVSIPWGKTGTSDFPLEPGDKLRLTNLPTPEDLKSVRPDQLLVTSPGTPLNRRYGHTHEGMEIAQSSLPTLIQILADLTGQWTTFTRGAPADHTVFPSWLTRSMPSDFTLQFLPHADYSKIRIRRLNDDGSETIIPIDLAGTIAAADPALTPEAARKADTLLRLGDIVEIPQQPGQAGKPWKGPTPAETAYFAKALDCRIQLNQPDRPLELREIRYQSPTYVEVAGNWIPLWPAAGNPTLNASLALGGLESTIQITRPGSKSPESAPASKLYLRDGDIVRSDNSLISPPPAPQPTRPSRPRIVPIPPPGN
jgi:ankyrin repeat protein